MVYDAVETFFEGGPSKVDQKANRQVHQAEIRKKLLAVDRSQLFHGFEFDYHCIFYKQINSQAFFKQNPIIFKTDDLLSFHMETAPFEHFS
jgi:hypothetical protein